MSQCPIMDVPIINCDSQQYFSSFILQSHIFSDNSSTIICVYNFRLCIISELQQPDLVEISDELPPSLIDLEGMKRVLQSMNICSKIGT